MAKLYRRFAPKKQVHLVFNGDWDPDRLTEMGALSICNAQEALLEVEPAETAAVTARICAQFPIRDITIMEPPLESIMASIYAQRPE